MSISVLPRSGLLEQQRADECRPAVTFFASDDLRSANQF